MSQIYQTNSQFDFDKINLLPPTVITGGNHFIRFTNNSAPLYIQTPKCMLKCGISKTNKRSYCDLMFSNQDIDFIKWMEDLEVYACKTIFDNKLKWFESDMELSDIENYFASPLKIYKSGKNYLARANIPTCLGKINLKIYNNDEEEIDPDTITDNTNIISIIEVQGIKCSARCFQIELEVKQMLILPSVNLFDKCILVNKSNEIKEPTNANTLDENIHMVINEESDKTKEYKDYSDESIEKEEEKEEEEEVKEESSDITQDLNDFELDINLEDIPYDEQMKIKPRNDVYYELYKEARKKAIISRNMAIQSYLEATEIKTKYNLDIMENDEDHFFENVLNSDSVN
jgi:hypothetical protein